jgi:hypothetical protein
VSRKRYATMFERLLANSVKPPEQNENGCWLWTGRKDGKYWPYGLINKRIDGKHVSVRVHREMEQQMRNAAAQLASDDAQPLWAPLPTVTALPLCPEGETIDHLCARLCINPDHWSTVTRVENSALSQQRNPRKPRK